jgi:hypothetical protein
VVFCTWVKSDFSVQVTDNGIEKDSLEAANKKAVTAFAVVVVVVVVVAAQPH